jgi:hypothetical protein
MGVKVSKALTLGAIATFGSVASTATIAEEQLDFSPGFYVTATAGETKIDFSSSLKLGGNGYALGVGYDVNKYVAVEASYNSFFDYTVNGNAYAIDGFAYRGMLRYPMGSWAPYVGYTYITAQDTLTVNSTTYSGAGTLSGTSIGAELALTDTISVRFMHDSLETNTNFDATVTHIGLVTRF